MHIDELLPGSVPNWAGYTAGAAWALRRSGIFIDGADLTVRSDLPVGAGLSSSAAVCCATVLALAAAFGRSIEPEACVRLAHAAETDFMKVPCGRLDQFAICLSAPDHALLFDAKQQSGELVPFDLTSADLALLIIDTGVRRDVATTAYQERLAGCQQACAQLGVESLREIEDLDSALADLAGEPELARLCRHVVTESRRVRQAVSRANAGELAAIGPLMTASHASLRDDYAVSCRELDVVVEAAVDSGALGARMTGAGFGGCAIALVRRTTETFVTDAIAEAADRADQPVPTIWPVTPSEPARVQT